jgi:uncharacterized membrane protein YphA (DoxX/SURF4 family)
MPKGIPARDVLAYLCALVSLASGIGLLWKRSAALGAFVLLGFLILWLLLWRNTGSLPPVSGGGDLELR